MLLEIDEWKAGAVCLALGVLWSGGYFAARHQFYETKRLEAVRYEEQRRIAVEAAKAGELERFRLQQEAREKKELELKKKELEERERIAAQERRKEEEAKQVTEEKLVIENTQDNEGVIFDAPVLERLRRQCKAKQVYEVVLRATDIKGVKRLCECSYDGKPEKCTRER